MSAHKAATEVAFTMDAADLLRGINNARLFTGADAWTPTLCAVHMRGAADGVSFAATDRYCIGLTTVPVKVAAFEFLLRADDAALLGRVFNSKSGLLHLTVSADGQTLTVQPPTEGVVTAPQVVVTCRAEDGTFPKYREILDKATEPDPKRTGYEAGAHLGLNPKYLARFARVKSDLPFADSPLKVRVFATDGPVLVSIGDQFTGAIMPVRLADSVSKRNAA